MNSLIFLYSLAFLLSIFFGMIARKTQFCPLGGIADIIKEGNDGRFYMYLFAIAVAILGATVLEFFSILSFDNTKPPYRISQFRWPGYVIGGFLFGIGMTLCRGCGMKNMLNFGAGDLRAVVAIAGMSISAYVLLYTEGLGVLFEWINLLSPDLSNQAILHQDLGSIANYFFGGDIKIWRVCFSVVIAVILIYKIFNSNDFTQRKDNITGGFLIGSIIIGAYYISGGQSGVEAIEASHFMDFPPYNLGMQSYTFIRPMGDMIRVMTDPVLYLITLGLVMFIGVGVGSLIYSLFSRNFKLQGVDMATAPRYFTGGLLVGIGGILGMGCTLGQGVAGTSTLALGSFINLIALIFGAYVGIKSQYRFMHDHKVPS